MRILMLAAVLAAFAYSAPCSAQSGTELMAAVNNFNEKIKAALSEYRETGDYQKYKATVEPLIDGTLPQLFGGLRDAARSYDERKN